MLAAMTPASRQRVHPAAAGTLLLSVTLATIALVSLVGWAAGSWTLGALAGAVAGIPAGVFAVYRRYGGSFS